MASNEIFSSAQILKNTDSSEEFALKSFGNSASLDQQLAQEVSTPANNTSQPAEPSAATQYLEHIVQEMQLIKQQVQQISDNGVSSKELDTQIINSIQELSKHASFFEKSIMTLEQRMLDMSFSIAKKIIDVEISAQSEQIARSSLSSIFERVKNAAQISIHLNPKDIVVIKNTVTHAENIEFVEDSNVSPGGIVISSDLGNFDGTIESKLEILAQSLGV